MGARLPRHLAAFVWYAGAVVLSIKAISIIVASDPKYVSGTAVAITIVTGIGIGILKGLWLFAPTCRRNLLRISKLPKPKIWQAFRPQFWVALLAMILFAGQLSRWAQGYPLGLMAVAALDLTIATALWIGGRPFWQNRNSA